MGQKPVSKLDIEYLQAAANDVDERSEAVRFSHACARVNNTMQLVPHIEPFATICVYAPWQHSNLEIQVPGCGTACPVIGHIVCRAERTS
jgi:hypothetical protein